MTVSGLESHSALPSLALMLRGLKSPLELYETEVNQVYSKSRSDK